MRWDGGDDIDASHSFEGSLAFTASSLRQDLHVSAKLMLSPHSVMLGPRDPGTREQLNGKMPGHLKLDLASLTFSEPLRQ